MQCLSDALLPNVFTSGGEGRSGGESSIGQSAPKRVYFGNHTGIEPSWKLHERHNEKIKIKKK